VPSLDEGNYTVGREHVFRFVSYLQATSSKEADDAYLATKELLNKTLVDEASELERFKKSVGVTLDAVNNAKSHFQRAQDHLKDAALEKKRAEDSAMTANDESARTNTFATAEAACGDEARARVARERSKLANDSAQLANEQVALAAKNYDYLKAVVSEAELAARKAASHSASAKSLQDLGQKDAEKLVAARTALKQAEVDAKEAYNREAAMRQQSDNVGAKKALDDLFAARGIAEKKSKDVFAHAEQIKQFAEWAVDRERDARDEAQRANEAANFARSYTDLIRKSAIRIEQLTADAARNAQLAGRVIEKDADTHRAWDQAEEKAAYDAAVNRLLAANSDSDENGVRRARESAKAAETLASHEWNKAASRIAEGEANAIRSRAEKVIGPSSPFYFAAAAHFPLREFGLRGELLDHDGIIIYEDMAFHFDRDGNYEVHFRASAPPMPAIMRLQFQIQPHRNGPWYTITLAPIEFPYPTAKGDKSTCSGSNCGDANCSKETKKCNGNACRPRNEAVSCCGEARECVCKGHSEILRRCYGEMGQDAQIRRSGTARIGFGVNVP
jgi:hypothetical protein